MNKTLLPISAILILVSFGLLASGSITDVQAQATLTVTDQFDQTHQVDVSQFIIAGPDACFFDHFHAANGEFVISINGARLDDPAPFVCGYGIVGLPLEGTLVPVCGNGAIEEGETCDDANTKDGDGCDSSCNVEPGFTCDNSNPPSVCTADNNPPDLVPILDQSVDEGGTLLVPLSASDPDGNGITLSATGLPSFAVFLDNGDGTGKITFSPKLGQAGTFSITVTATDDGTPPLTDSETFQLKVNAKLPGVELLLDLDEGATEDSSTLVPLGQFIIALPDQNCAQLHYVAANGQGFVIAIDGTKILDPDPNGCSYGVLEVTPIITATVIRKNTTVPNFVLPDDEALVVLPGATLTVNNVLEIEIGEDMPFLEIMSGGTVIVKNNLNMNHPEGEISLDGTLIVEKNLTFLGCILVEDGGILTVKEDLKPLLSSDIIVEKGGKVTVEGKVSSTGTISIRGGTVKVETDLNASGPIIVDGSLTVEFDMLSDETIDIAKDGTLTVGRTFEHRDNDITNTGGTLNVNNFKLTDAEVDQVGGTLKISPGGKLEILSEDEESGIFNRDSSRIDASKATIFIQGAPVNDDDDDKISGGFIINEFLSVIDVSDNGEMTLGPSEVARGEGGQIENDGELLASDGGKITLKLGSKLKNDKNGKIDIRKGGTLETNRDMLPVLARLGGLENDGKILHDSNETIQNDGNIINGITGVVENSGLFNNIGITENFGSLNNSGILKNLGIFNNHCTGSIINTGEILGNPTVDACDTDVDGIADSIDLEPGVQSVDFDDNALPTPTTGTILDSGDQTLIIRDDANPSNGVRIIAETGGGTNPAQVSMCFSSSTINLDADDEAIVTCSSVTVLAIGGTISIIFIGSDGTEIATSLQEGNKLTFEPDTLIISADSQNTEDVIVFVDGEQIILSPGEQVTLLSSPSVVGGEIIPIDSTALILAGAQSTTWMIPAIVAAIGIGIVIARKY